jgi:hypothetical protein
LARTLESNLTAVERGSVDSNHFRLIVIVFVLELSFPCLQDMENSTSHDHLDSNIRGNADRILA